MKKTILPALFLLVSLSSLSAQLVPSILSLSTTPANPNSGNAIGIISVAGDFPWGGCPRINHTLTQNGPNAFTIDGYYCMGGLTYICSHTDTTWLPQIPSGTYTVTYNLYYSGGGVGVPCLAFTSGNGGSFSFTATCMNPSQINANFSYSASNLTYQFNDLTTGGGTAWFWTFGTGANSSQQNPAYTFPAPGNYTVCLISSDSCGRDTICQNVNVSCPLPVAQYSSVANQLSVNFTNLSSGSGLSHSWDFGDGSQSGATNPIHQFSSPGTYIVCLISTNTCGSDTVCDTLIVNCPTPSAAYTWTSQLDTVNFSTSNPQAGNIYFWDFGDGDTSQVQNPTHIYANSGNYFACLYQTNTCGKDTFCDSISINLVGRHRDLKAHLFSVFPNPASDQLNALNSSPFEVELLLENTLGQIVERRELLPGQQLEIRLNLCSGGMYFARWIQESEQIHLSTPVIILPRN